MSTLGPPVAADTPLSAGAALPQLSAPARDFTVQGASSQYVMYQGGGQYDESNPTTNYAIVRTSDGQTVHSFTTARDQDTALDPTLVRDSFLTLVRPQEGESHVEVRTAEAGTLVRTIDVSGQFDKVIHSDPLWVMGSTNVGPNTGNNVVRIIKANGSVTTVPGEFFMSPRWVGGTDTTAYISASEGDFAVDIATGAKTLLTFPDGALLNSVSPTHLIASETTNVNGAPTIQLRSLKRSDLTAGWSVDLPQNYSERGFYPLGTGLGEIYIRDDAPSASHLSLRPVDTTTGARGADWASNTVMGVGAMDDARLALTLRDTPTGRIGLASSGELTTLTTLPVVAELAIYVASSGQAVHATWNQRSGLWSTSSAGGGIWAETGAERFAAHTYDRKVSAAGDVVMTPVTTGSPGIWRLTWTGGGRDIASDYPVVLGHGGRYLVRYTGPSGGELQDVRTGGVVATFAGSRVVDEDMSWAPPTAAAAVVGTDLGTGATTVRSVPAACARGHLRDVRGRWAYLGCTGTDAVVDLLGVLPGLALPISSGGSVFLGNNFVVVGDATTSPITAKVTDLVTGNSTTYGPVRGASRPPGFGIGINDDDTKPGFAYIDPTYQVRFVDLPWVTAPTDVKAPVITAVAGSPAWPAELAPQVSYAVQAMDNKGVVGYDFEQRTAGAGKGWAAWTTIGTQPSGQLTTAALAPGTGTCLRARARDAAGNLSDFTPAHCVTAPLDDRKLKAKHGALKKKSPQAIGKTVLKLPKGASASSPAQTGTSIALWIVRGKGLGKAQVLIGKKLIGVVKFAASTTRSELVLLAVPSGFTGKVTVRNKGKRPVLIDALAVGR